MVCMKGAGERGGFGARLCMASAAHKLARLARVEACNLLGAPHCGVGTGNDGGERDTWIAAGGLALACCCILEFRGGAGIEAALPGVDHGSGLLASLHAVAVIQTSVGLVNFNQCCPVPLAQRGAQALPAQGVESRGESVIQAAQQAHRLLLRARRCACTPIDRSPALLLLTLGWTDSPLAWPASACGRRRALCTGEHSRAG